MFDELWTDTRKGGRDRLEGAGALFAAGILKFEWLALEDGDPKHYRHTWYDATVYVVAYVPWLTAAQKPKNPAIALAASRSVAVRPIRAGDGFGPGMVCPPPCTV